MESWECAKLSILIWDSTRIPSNEHARKVKTNFQFSFEIQLGGEKCSISLLVESFNSHLRFNRIFSHLLHPNRKNNFQFSFEIQLSEENLNGVSSVIPFQFSFEIQQTLVFCFRLLPRYFQFSFEIQPFWLLRKLNYFLTFNSHLRFNTEVLKDTSA